jgi:hypothetical protein
MYYLLFAIAQVITLAGYTVDEKAHIGCRHLLPKALTEHGLSPANVHLPRHVMEHIITRYACCYVLIHHCTAALALRTPRCSAFVDGSRYGLQLSDHRR